MTHNLTTDYHNKIIRKRIKGVYCVEIRTTTLMLINKGGCKRHASVIKKYKFMKIFMHCLHIRFGSSLETIKYYLSPNKSEFLGIVTF